MGTPKLIVFSWDFWVYSTKLIKSSFQKKNVGSSYVRVNWEKLSDILSYNQSINGRWIKPKIILIRKRKVVCILTIKHVVK